MPPVAIVASELLPFVRTLHARRPDPRLAALLPPRWTRYWQGQLYEQQQQQQPGGMGAAGEQDAGGGDGASEEIEDSDGCAMDDDYW